MQSFEPPFLGFHESGRPPACVSERHALDHTFAESGKCGVRVRLALAPPRGVTRQPFYPPYGGRARRADASPEL